MRAMAPPRAEHNTMAGKEEVKIKRESKPNWNPDKFMYLYTLVEGKISIVIGRFSPYLTSNDKKAPWDNICDELNAAFQSPAK